MKINTDFIHPDDAPTVLSVSQHSFLAENVTLQVRVFENADIYPEAKYGGLLINKENNPPANLLR